LERLPEVVWIAEMVHALGTADSLDSLCTVLECAFDAQREGDVTVPLLASYWAGARDETKNHVRKTLRVNDELGLVGSGLQTLSSLYPGYPTNFLCETDEPRPRDATELTEFKNRLRVLCDRFSHEAVVVHAHMVKAYIMTGRLHLPADRDLPSLEVIYADDADTESCEYHTAEGFARACAGNFFAAYSQQFPLTTADYFWNRGLELEPCDPFCWDEEHE